MLLSKKEHNLERENRTIICSYGKPPKIGGFFSIIKLGLVTSYQLPVTSYQLPVTSYQLPVTSYQLPVTSYQLPVTSYQNDRKEKLDKKKEIAISDNL